MISRTTKIVTGFIGLLIFSVFTIGLSHSISTGFAGVMGGLPFSLVVGFVLCLAAYNFYEECIRRDDTDND